MIENDRVVFARDAQIIGGGERLFAQIVKAKPRHAHESARHMHAAAVQRQRQILRRAVIAAGQPPPGLVHRLVGCGIRRHVPDRLAAELFQAKVGASVEPHHVHALFQHLDERHEQRAVETVLVKILRRNVRSRDHDDAALEQLREQPAEDHGIGDIGDMEFVKAEQPGFFGERCGDNLDRVLAVIFAELHFLADDVHALMNVEHEFVKMRAALAHHRTCFEEEVHQHGLATADRAIDVKALDRGLRAGAAREQPAERRGFARQAMFDDARFELRHLADDGQLRLIFLDAAGSDRLRILCCDRVRHEALQ